MTRTFWSFLWDMLCWNGSKLREFNSPEGEEERAVRATCSVSSGNVNMQARRVITPVQHEAEMEDFVRRAENRRFSYLR